MIAVIATLVGLGLTACSDGGDYLRGFFSGTHSSTSGTGGSGSSVFMEMVSIPAGTLQWPNATITLSAFKMGKYQVTQEQYQTVMGTNPSHFSSNPATGEIQGRRP